MSPLPPPFPELFLLSTMPHGMEHPCGQFRSTIQVYPLPSCCLALAYLLLERWGKRQSLAAVHALFSYGQNFGVTNTVLAPKTKHSSIWAARKKANSISARTSTTVNTGSTILCLFRDKMNVDDGN